MRTLLHIALWSLPLVSMAQVSVDRPLVLSGTTDGERVVSGVAPAVEGSALIDLEGARSGRYHLAQAQPVGTGLALTSTPPCTAYANGLELRFLAPTQVAGVVQVNVDGLGNRPLRRSDGGLVSFGDVEPGRMVEIIYRDTAFLLVGRASDHCPAGFIQLNERLCIQRNDTLNMSVFNASKWCMERGARLCTWDEYLYACTKESAQFQGFADDWEWVDDTSDHTHTAFQVGRWTCRSARNFSAYETPASYAGVRCCYHVK